MTMLRTLLRTGAITSLAVGTLLGCAGCNGLPDLPEMIEGDWEPPILQQVEPVSERAVALVFNEEVRLSNARFDPSSGEVTDSMWDADYERLVVTVTTPFETGAEYHIEAEVADLAGNISAMLASFYGHNPDLPTAVINEVVCEGSTTHPDWVELRVLEAGNLGGMCLYEGGPDTWESRFVFPQITVEADAYVIVHFKPEGTTEEITEVEDPSASGGADSHPNAWDAWVTGGDGIPNSTGGVALAEWPGGPLLDAFLYTTKHYVADDEKRGFGLASQLEIFEDIVAQGGWVIAGDFVVPDDGFDPEDSTATRSICRGSDATDTDEAVDWHIVPTSGATPGYLNNDEVYLP